MLKLVFWIFRLIFKDRNNLILENLALRQQLAVQERNINRPRLRNQDRVFWSLLSQIWTDWKSALLIVKPETVVKWHRKGFKLFWRWKSRSKPGRPKVSKEIRDLIYGRDTSPSSVTYMSPGIYVLLFVLANRSSLNHPILQKADLI